MTNEQLRLCSDVLATHWDHIDKPTAELLLTGMFDVMFRMLEKAGVEDVRAPEQPAAPRQAEISDTRYADLARQAAEAGVKNVPAFARRNEGESSPGLLQGRPVDLTRCPGCYQIGQLKISKAGVDGNGNPQPERPYRRCPQCSNPKNSAQSMMWAEVDGISAAGKPINAVDAWKWKQSLAARAKADAVPF